MGMGMGMRPGMQVGGCPYLKHAHLQAPHDLQQPACLPACYLHRAVPCPAEAKESSYVALLPHTTDLNPTPRRWAWAAPAWAAPWAWAWACGLPSQGGGQWVGGRWGGWEGRRSGPQVSGTCPSCYLASAVPPATLARRSLCTAALLPIAYLPFHLLAPHPLPLRRATLRPERSRPMLTVVQCAGGMGPRPPFGPGMGQPPFGQRAPGVMG